MAFIATKVIPRKLANRPPTCVIKSIVNTRKHSSRYGGSVTIIFWRRGALLNFVPDLDLVTSDGRIHKQRIRVAKGHVRLLNHDVCRACGGCDVHSPGCSRAPAQ